MQLSVLIPSIEARAEQAAALYRKVAAQATGLPVEVLMLTDNRKLLLQAKRNALMQLSTGSFIAHLDDDDAVSSDYVSSIVTAAQANPEADVICFDQISDLGDGRLYRVSTSLQFENQDSRLLPDGRRADITRKPWHWCAWRGELARRTPFQTSAYGEDWNWIARMITECRQEVRLERVLHFYQHSPMGTAF